MEIKEFWAVIKPTQYSGVSDICFKSTPQTIGLQFLGGLKPDDVIGFYANADEAEVLARGLIKDYEHLRDEFKRHI